MKRISSIMMVLVLVLGLVGCGSSEESEQQPSPTAAVEAPAAQTDDNKTSDEPVPTTEPTSAPEQEDDGKQDGGDDATETSSLGVYEDFLYGDALVEVYGTAERCSDGRYGINDLIAEYGACLAAEGLPSYYSTGGAALIDCGDDGVLELQLTLTFSDYRGEEVVDELLVIKDIGGNFELMGSEETFSRYESSINAKGYGSMTGSGGANSSVSETFMYNSSCDRITIMKENTWLSLEEPRIIDYCLPEGEARETLGLHDEFAEDGYELRETELFSESGNRTLYAFAYTDSDPDYVPDEAYVEACALYGVTIVSAGELDRQVNEALAAAHVTDEIKEAPAADLQRIVVDKPVSVGLQIEKFIGERDVWCIPDAQSPQDGDIAYLILDLDMNGRIDLIRTQTQFPLMSHSSSFFELDRDFSHVVEKQFTGTSDGMGADMSTPSYWKCCQIQSPEGYCGGWKYLIPTSIIDGDGNETVRNYVLTASVDGTVVLEESAEPDSFLTGEHPHGIDGEQKPISDSVDEEALHDLLNNMYQVYSRW